MPAKSPVDIVGSAPLSVQVKVNGAIHDDVALISITTHHQTGQFSEAQITVGDGVPSNADFPVADSGIFASGTEIEILAGYSESMRTIFIGSVAGQQIEISDSRTALIISCKSRKKYKPTISTVKKTDRSNPVLRIAYGESIINFNAECKVTKKQNVITGNVSFQGSHIWPGEVISLEGVSKLFSKNMLVDTVTHIIKDGNWLTQSTFSS